MLEILFVIGFFLMLLMTGISLLGILIALVVAMLVMFVSGLFVVVIKLLPWLMLAMVVVYLYQAFSKQQTTDRNNLPK